MMRWATFILLFYFGSVCAQNATDSTTVPEPEWETKNYTQEDKIYNRSVWTFVDNPALAGFDRKLAVAYRYRMKNLAMGVPNKDGNLTLAFQRHEAFVDLPFGGPKQNWGMGLYYSYEKELQHTYHRIQMARSFRIQFPKGHNLILGFSVGVQLAKLNNQDRLTFPDMIDPRSGFIYSTWEPRRWDHMAIPYLNGGIRYYWKRFVFDYAVQLGPSGVWALAGAPRTSDVRNKFKAAYHFNVGDDVTISPELVGEIITYYGVFYPNGPDKPHINKATNNFGLFSGYVTITYKDMVYGQIGVADLNRWSFRAGYQLKDYLVIQLGVSSYLNPTMEKIGGLASVDGGIRYQIKAWNR
ncbi:MAG: type IX secretion system membrane protein PorP/SprF [Flavobacteriales bacterium]|nr:type IX secretion system membrane protein PorP/SprF [Flavobacteriales bacterium]